MRAFISFDKGLGSTAIYAVVTSGDDFYDFTAKAFGALTDDCKVWLEEQVSAAADTVALYLADLTVPAGGPYTLKYYSDISGYVIGYDLVWGGTDTPTGGTGTPSGAGVTREMFATKVLSTLGVYDRSGMDPQDMLNVLDAYDAVYQELKDDGLVTWAQGGEAEVVPTRFLRSLIAITAASDDLLGGYGIDQGKCQELKAASVMATRQIRRQLASAQDTETVYAEYF